MPPMIVKSAQKNHGKCAYCPNDIEPGDSYIKQLRDATLAEIEDPDKKTPYLWGCRKIEDKIHTECKKRVVEAARQKRIANRQRPAASDTQSLGNLLP